MARAHGPHALLCSIRESRDSRVRSSTRRQSAASSCLRSSAEVSGLSIFCSAHRRTRTRTRGHNHTLIFVALSCCIVSLNSCAFASCDALAQLPVLLFQVGRPVVSRRVWLLLVSLPLHSGLGSAESSLAVGNQKSRRRDAARASTRFLIRLLTSHRGPTLGHEKLNLDPGLSALALLFPSLPSSLCRLLSKMLETVRSRQIYGFLVVLVLPGDIYF